MFSRTTLVRSEEGGLHEGRNSAKMQLQWCPPAVLQVLQSYGGLSLRQAGWAFICLCHPVTGAIPGKKYKLRQGRFSVWEQFPERLLAVSTSQHLGEWGLSLLTPAFTVAFNKIPCDIVGKNWIGKENKCSP